MMKQELLVLRTSIKTAVKRKTLYKGITIGFIGISLILFGGTGLSEKQLSFFGIPIFLISMGLITFGLLPYRRFTIKELNPDKLILKEAGCLEFCKKEKKLFDIPIKSISEVYYIEKGTVYGIGVILKNPLPEKIRVYEPGFDMLSFQNKSRNKFQCDLFFQCFTERSAKDLREWV